MNAVTVSEAKQNLEQLIAQVISEAEPVIVRTEAGENVVLLSLSEFSSWQETLHLLSDPSNAEHLRQSIEEAQTGKTVEHGLLDV